MRRRDPGSPSAAPTGRGTVARIAPLACGILLALAAPRAAAPADPPARARYAVLPFVVSPYERDLSWLSEALAFSVSRRLDALGFPVAGARERADAAETAGVPRRPATLAARLKLARALNARRAVTGSLRLERASGEPISSGELVVTALVLDVADGRVAVRRNLSGSLEDLYRLMDEIALEAASSDPAPAGPGAMLALGAVGRPPLAALEAVMRALAEPDVERRARALEAAATAPGGDPSLLRALAAAHMEDGRPEAARAILSSLDPAAQHDPWRLHLERAEVHLALGDVAGAEAAAARSLSGRDSAAAHVLLGRAALERGDPVRAEAEERRAAAIDPDEPSLAGLRRQMRAPPAETLLMEFFR